MNELTLCMIVRDEEALLPACLEAARSAVDRMVIVDTGSRDGTRDVIRRFGAELVEHPWSDDFAAARNAGLERIEEGYVLVLDADERLTEQAARTLRGHVRKGHVELGMLPLHDASSLGAFPEEVVSGRARRGEPHWLPRLLRRTPDLRYQGIVHETVADWARAGRRTEWIDAPIVHYGAVPELRAAREKDERNRRLLERRCELEPESAQAWAYLAAELARREDAGAALDAARRAWRAWQTRGRAAAEDAVLPASLLAQLALGADRLDEARAVAGEALDAQEHPNLHLLAGVALEQGAAGDDAEALEGAVRHYERCLALHGERFDSEVMPGATSWQAATRLGTVRLQQARPELARAAFERALEARADLLEAALGLAEAPRHAGEVARALGLLEPLLEQSEPDAWLLAARGALRLASPSDARLFAARARQAAGERSFHAPHRRRALDELEGGLAAEGAPSAASAQPDPGLCVFAWPRYDAPEDLDTLFRDYGKLLADRAGVVLCLRHDPATDGALTDAEIRLSRSFGDHLGPAHSLEVVLVDGSQRPEGLAAHGDLAIELPHTQGARRSFLEALGVPRIGSTDALASALPPPTARG